jgi:alpha-glucosidase
MFRNDSAEELLWWQRGVVYQIYPRSFKDTDGDGVGDLQGIVERLDYLNTDPSVDAAGISPDGPPISLGVEAIWLSPFYPSPMADFGYDVADYCDVHPMFGDLDTFDRLVDGAHQRGIKVIIDFVPNHTSDQHPWFLESRSSREDPKRDWYLWVDPKPDGSPPNNWGSVFGGPAWEWDERTGQYYFHQFLKEQPDLNWRNPEVREAMIDVLRFWLDRGVDGFRMDVVGMILKDPQLRDNPPDPNAPPDLPEADIYGQQLNIYNQDLDEVHEIIQEFRRVLDAYGQRCSIGEIWYELPRWVNYYGTKGEGLHLPFNFRLMNLPWTAKAIRASVDELESALPEGAWPNYVLGNHDRDRLASRVGLAQARVAAMLLLTLRGTPTLYYGDEIGLENGLIPPEKLQDPQGLRLGAERTRDVARTPMQWDDSPNASFSTGEPWLPISPDYRECNVARQAADPASILNLYRHLLRLRRQFPALYGGSYQPVDAGCEDCFVYRREHGGRRYIIALNFTSKPQHLSISGEMPEDGARVLLSTFLDRSGPVSLSAFELRPDEGLLIDIKGRPDTT